MTLETQSNEVQGTENEVEVSNEQTSSDSQETKATEETQIQKSLKDLASEKTVKTKGAVDEKKTATEKPSAYSPNYKFKVLDKEHEVDESLKPLFKDAETEKKIKELYEKAYGIEAIKADRQALREKYTEVERKFSEQDKALEQLGEYVREDDFDSFFDSLRIPKEKVLKYALDLVNRSEMTPEQKKAFEQQRQLREENRMMRSQNQELSERQKQIEVQKRNYELDLALGRQDVQTVANSYNGLMNDSNAFKNFVIQIAQTAHEKYDVDLTTDQAVQQAIKTITQLNPSLAGNQTPQQVIQKQQEKPVIPNIQGRGTSPVARTYKSFDDLKRRKKELDLEFGQQEII